MTWQPIALAFVAHAKLILAGIGFGGTGIGIVKFLNHAPAPFQDQVWYGACWDTLQDMVSNTARIGQRRTREGVAVALPSHHLRRSRSPLLRQRRLSPHRVSTVPEYLVHVGQPKVLLDRTPVLVSVCPDPVEIVDLPVWEYDQRKYVCRGSAESLVRKYPGQYQITGRMV
jgi:hypothetical protein